MMKNSDSFKVNVPISDHVKNGRCIKNRLILMKFVFSCDCLFFQSVVSYSTLIERNGCYNDIYD